jgi:hypothetical protein
MDSEAKGGPLPACKNKYRDKADLLEVPVEFLTSTLSIVPGETRNVYFSNQAFRSMPVYQRGGDSIRESI